MKYLSSLLPIILLAACNQASDQQTDQNPYEQYLASKPDSISSATNAVLEMTKQASRDAYNAKKLQENANNIWRYDVPMPGNTYRNTNSASLKANDVNAYLKLVHGKDLDMAVLLWEDDRFNGDEAMFQEIKVSFDNSPVKKYTCSVEPVFGFLIIRPINEFIQKIKASHSITIEAVTRSTVEKKVYEYPNGSTSSTYTSRRSRRRNRWSNKPREVTTTETSNNKQTFTFNSAGLKWNYPQADDQERENDPQ